MDTLAIIFGTTIVGLVAIQLGLVTISSFQSLRRSRLHHQMTEELFRERINAARAVREQKQQVAAAWNGYRKFVVDRKVREAKDVCSFYLVPHDLKPLPGFAPGQYLTFALDVPGREKPVVRCYSLSDSHAVDHYRVTIKRVFPPADASDAPPGIASNFFHDHVNEGDILDVKAPGGHFTLDPNDRSPVVLIGGGVGVTPLLSMAKTAAESGLNRELWFFYGVRNGLEHAMKEELTQLARAHDRIHVITCYSRPGDEDVEGQHYNHAGHVDVDLLRRYLETNNYKFFICGPPPMMKTITAQFKDWGVPKDDVLTEAFGPASIKAKKEVKPKAGTAETKPDVSFRISFARSGKELPWDPTAPNLLEFASRNGVEIDSACCAGGCGTCEVAIKSGEVEYDDPPECEVGQGCCLTCIGRPKGDIILDA